MSENSSSAKETARVRSATTTRSSPSVILIDDGTLDTIFCPADGLSIASTLDDVFCSTPTDASVIDTTPTQRRRKQITDVRSPNERGQNGVASPKTPSRRSTTNLSKHRKSEVRSSPRYPSASKSRKEEEKEANLHHKCDEAENIVARRRTPQRTASKSRIDNDEMHAEGTKRMSKRRYSNPQVGRVKQQQIDFLDNSKRSRSSSHKAAIKNLEMRVERSISSHRRGYSESRIRDSKQQKKRNDIKTVERVSRIVSTERTGDRSESAHSRKASTLLFEKADHKNKGDKSTAPRRSDLSPQRSSSTSRIESLDRQTRRSLNKRSASDSRIVQADHEKGTDEIKQSAIKRISPQRRFSKSKINNLGIQIERPRSSHGRRNSYSPTEKGKAQPNERIIENSKRTARSLQRSTSKTRIATLEMRVEHSRSSHRRGNSKSGMNDINLRNRNDDTEKSERTRSSNQTCGSHDRSRSKPRVEQLKNLEIEGKSRRIIDEHKRRSSKSGLNLVNETELVDRSERTRSSHKRRGSNSQNSEQQETRPVSRSGYAATVSSQLKYKSTTTNVSGPDMERCIDAKQGSSGDPRSEKGYLIKPFWRKSSDGGVNVSTAEIISTKQLESDIPVRSPRNDPMIHDRKAGRVAKGSEKRSISRSILHSNFQPRVGKDWLSDKAPPGSPHNEAATTREHFPTELAASEAAIIPKKEERVALLQSTGTNEQEVTGSPRERIKSLSPTKFLKKASKRFTNAVAQLQERILPVGANDMLSRERRYTEPLPAEKISETAPQESAIRVNSSDWNPQQSSHNNLNAKDRKAEPSTINDCKVMGRPPSPTQRKSARLRPRSNSTGRLELESSRTISPTRKIVPRQNSQRAIALKIRSASLRRLGSPSARDKISETFSPHRGIKRQPSGLGSGSLTTSVATPSTKSSSDSSSRPAGSSPRHRRRHASSIAARQPPFVSPITDSDHIHRPFAGISVQVLLSEALLPPAISSWSSSLLVQVFLQDGNQWVCYGERNLQNKFTETLFSFEFGCEQARKLSGSFIEVRIYDGFNFRGCLHLPTDHSYEATWFDVRTTSLNKECVYPHAKGQIQVSASFQGQTMPLIETGFVLELPSALEFYAASGEIHCIAVDRDRGIIVRDGSCVYQDLASQNKSLQRMRSGLQLMLSMVPMSVGAIFLIATDLSSDSEHCVVRRPDNQVGIGSIKMDAMKTTILARITRNPSQVWEMTGICQSYAEVPNLGLLFPMLPPLCCDMVNLDSTACHTEAWTRPGESICLQNYCSNTNSLRVEVHSEGQVTAILSDNNGRKIDFVDANQPQSRDGKSVSLHPNVRNAFSLDLASLSLKVNSVGFVVHAASVPPSSSLINFRFVVRNRQTMVVQYLNQERYVTQDSPEAMTAESESVWLGCFYRNASRNEWNFISLGIRTHLGQDVAALSLDLHKNIPLSAPSPVASALQTKPLGDLVYLDRRE